MSVAVTAPPARVLVGASVTAQVTVENTAPVAVAQGADELDYEITGSGAVVGSAVGMVAAASSGAVEALSFDTSAAGPRMGQVDVLSQSQAVANGSFQATVSATVLEHAMASFQSASLTDFLQLDFGSVPVGSGLRHLSAGIWNLAAPSGFTAALDLEAITPLGDIATLTTDLTPFENLGTGIEYAFDAFFDTSAAGDFVAVYTLQFADEDIPGGQPHRPVYLSLKGSVYVPGDMDGNGWVDFDDIGVFVLGLTDPAAYADQFGVPASLCGDLDGDGDQDFDDIDSFVALLAGGRSGTVRAVPEPLAVGQLALAAALLAAGAGCRATPAGSARRPPCSQRTIQVS
jgi:hypothetical protein